MDYRYAPAPNSAAVTPRPIPVPFSLAPAISLESNGGNVLFLSTKFVMSYTARLKSIGNRIFKFYINI